MNSKRCGQTGAPCRWMRQLRSRSNSCIAPTHNHGDKMNWYLIVKYLHIIAVTITVGGMFARQLVRSAAQNSDDVNIVASLTHVAVRMDRSMVIPASNLMIIFGIILAIMQKWPIFGFLQG